MRLLTRESCGLRRRYGEEKQRERAARILASGGSVKPSRAWQHGALPRLVVLRVAPKTGPDGRSIGAFRAAKRLHRERMGVGCRVLFLAPWGIDKPFTLAAPRTRGL